MAPTRRSAAAAAVEEESEPEEGLVRLKFDQPLTWRAGKPIQTGELHRRLDTLSKELSELEQETTDKDSLTKVAKELVSHNLLTHKDKGVKAFVACCLVDVLRVCAPNAPFTPAQLKDVFNLFITSIFPALQDPSHTYNTQHKYVLSSLAEVQSIVLLNDIDNNEALLLHLFSTFFDAVSGPKSASGERISKDVELHMVDVLVTVIDEGTSLPGKVVDVIMAQFLRAAAPVGGAKDRSGVDEGQSTLLLKTEPEAYQMAKQVCNSCPDKMARFVAQYFGDVIMDVTNLGGRSNGHKGGDESEEEEAAGGPSEADLKELRKAHQLLRELWRACPLILPNVIAQVDAELNAENLHLRQLATETLGDMISGIGAAGPPPPPIIDPAAYPTPTLADVDLESDSTPPANVLTAPLSPQSFPQTHPSVFHNFVNRKNDKSPAVRAAWTTAVGYILSTSAGGVGLSRDEESLLVKGLAEKIGDSDDRVRLASIRAIECFSFREVIRKLAPDGSVTKEGSVLGNLGDRIRDRKSTVRVEAMTLLGKLWAACTGELVSNPETVSALAGIPNRIFSLVYVNDPEINKLLDRVRFEVLVPLSFPNVPKNPSKTTNGGSQGQSQTQPAFDADAIRAHRILLMGDSMDTNNKKAFLSLQNRQAQFADFVDKFVDTCEEYNGGVGSSDKAKLAAKKVASSITYLTQFFPDEVKVKEDLHKFAKANDRRSYSLIKYATSRESDFKTVHRALKELSKRYKAQPSLADTVLTLLLRCANIMYNKSHLSTFLEYSKTDQDGLSAIAHEILNEISQKNPTLFKTHIGSLCKDLQDEAPTANKPNEPIVVETLKACASFAVKYPKDIPSDNSFNQTLVNYALYGKPPKAAKYAVNVLLTRADDKGMVAATGLLQKIMKDFGYGAPHFLNKLAAICQLGLLAPKVADDYEDTILGMALEQVLKKVRTTEPAPEGGWVEDADMDEECQAKLLSVKILANRLRSVSDIETARKNSETVLKLLRELVTKEGEVCKEKPTPIHHRKRLRLLAAQLMLKIATKFDDLVSPSDFNRLAEVAQDVSGHVRRRFIEKLQKYLSLGKLRARFYTIIFMTAYEPSEQFRSDIEIWIRSRVRHLQESNAAGLDSVLPRLISLLAHHPDFDLDLDSLVSQGHYMLFYISNVATESNLGLIQKYAERTKQVYDGIDEEKSENIYVLCDLALAVIKAWQEKRGWTSVPYPGKVGLPKGLFKGLPSHDAAQRIADKQWIPDGVDEKIEDLIRSIDRKKKRKHDDRTDQQNPAKKARPTKSSHPKERKTPKPSKKSSSSRSRPSKPKKVPASSSSPVPDSERRRSGRSRLSKSYMERDSSEDDEEMLEGVAEWDYESGSDAEGPRPRETKRQAAADSDGSGSPLSSPEPMEEDEKEEEKQDNSEEETTAANDEGADADEEDQGGDEDREEEEEETVRPTRSNGRRAAASRSAKATPKKPASTEKSGAKATAGTTTRLATRSKPRTRQREADNMEDDSDE
ncbi:hypothetical protein RB598_005112 [Gaeumannomyces tritici]